MINKINHIRNIGRFYDVIPKGSPSSDPSLQKFTLIFAENGTGKTTLTSILKSLDKNDSTIILEKQTISGIGPCQASIRVDDQDHTFANNNWRSRPVKKILVFDEEFVQRNVYTTSGIDANNKRELFNYVVLGEENVQKIEEMNSISTELATLRKDSNSLEAKLKDATGVIDVKTLLATKEVSLEEFNILTQEVEAEGIQVKNAHQIKVNAKLDKIKNLEWQDPTAILNKDIKSLEIAAEFKSHIQIHQQWLNKGTEIQGDGKSCPYCFQDVSNAEAIKTYKIYFSKECQDLLSEIDSAISKAKILFTDDRIALIQSVIKSNNDKCSFWNTVSLGFPSKLPFATTFEEHVKSYRLTLISILERKKADLFNKVVLSADESVALKLSDHLEDIIGSYNGITERENFKIEKIKNENSEVDIAKKKYEQRTILQRCIDVAFYNEEKRSSLNDYKSKIALLDSKRLRLDELKKEVKESSEELLLKYHKNINGFLRFINVDFRIAKVERRADNTSRETLVFSIELMGKSFDPNGSKGSVYTIANTLSSGDRSTLAFALFLAKLEHANLENHILVFDDPITSLDFFRKQQTSKKIVSLTQRASQVIVLSHSLEFCKLFAHVPVRGKYFKFNKVQSSTGVVITPYDNLTEICTAKHKDDHDRITTYLADPTSIDRMLVIKSIRSYVETLLCMYVPELTEVHPATLGKFIEYLRKQGVEADYIETLELINESIVEDNHGADNPTEDSYANLSDDELANICMLAKQVQAPPETVSP